MFRNKKGEGYIDTVITILISLIIVYTTVVLFTHFISYQKMNTAAEQIVEYVANKGEIGTEDVENHCALYIEKAGLDKNRILISFEDTEVIEDSENEAVQYGDKITVSLSSDYGIKLFNSGDKNYTMTVKKSALSEKYWK